MPNGYKQDVAVLDLRSGGGVLRLKTDSTQGYIDAEVSSLLGAALSVNANAVAVINDKITTGGRD